MAAVDGLDLEMASSEPSRRLGVFVISIVPEDHPRRRNISDQLDGLQFVGEIVQGLKAADPEAQGLYSPRMNLFAAKRSLTREEIAAYASHRKAWKAFLDSGFDHALILEDDFNVPFPAELLRAIDDCLANAGRWDVVKFFEFSRKRVWRRIRFASTQLVAHKFQSGGAVAYLLSRGAAERLLARRKVFRPVDEDMSWSWEFDLTIWTSEFNLVEEISDRLGGSHIATSRTAGKGDKNIARSIWGNFIQAWKLARSAADHCRRALEWR